MKFLDKIPLKIFRKVGVKITGNHEKDSMELSAILATDINFDCVKRDFVIGGRATSLFFLDAFIKDEVFEEILEYLYSIQPEEINKIHNMLEFSLHKMPYVEVSTEKDAFKTAVAVLSGQTAIIMDGIEDVLLVDTRTYPCRSIDEPDKDRSLRGSRDGFVETLMFNAAMIRRRIRDPRLRMEHFQVGTSSKTDVAIGYIDGLADERLIQKLKNKLKNVSVAGISMTSQALSEIIVPSSFFNPFPKVRFTERPDFASACILEGKVLLLLDNSPSVMIFPNSIADFSKETDDYYFPPLTGTYVRIIRAIVSLLTVLLTPITLVYLNNPHLLPHWLQFIDTKKEHLLPFFFQFLLLELVIDGLRLASLNTPDTLSSSLGIIGALILGEFAIEADWFVPETIMYMAFVAIASFAQPSFEMGYAMKFMRIVLLVSAQLFQFWGVGIGFVTIIVLAGFSKTLSGRGYLYPIFPFNARDFVRMFIRTNIRSNENNKKSTQKSK